MHVNVNAYTVNARCDFSKEIRKVLLEEVACELRPRGEGEEAMLLRPGRWPVMDENHAGQLDCSLV